MTALANIAEMHHRAGSLDVAADRAAGALERVRAVGDPCLEAIILGNLGSLETRRGRYPAAVRHLERAVALSQANGDRLYEGITTCNLALVASRAGRHENAEHHLRRALAIFRSLDDRRAEAAAIAVLGQIYTRQGKCAQGIDMHEQAHRVLSGLLPGQQRIDNPLGVNIANGLGEALAGCGRFQEAHAAHTTALTDALRAKNLPDQARALHGLGRVHHATGDLARAAEHWRRALDLYTRMGTPEAEELQAQLASLSRSTPEP